MENLQLLKSPGQSDSWTNKSTNFVTETMTHFFPEELYIILHSSHDFASEKQRYIRSSSDPGFQIEIKSSKVNFRVECKVAENVQDDEAMDLLSADQLQTYKLIENSFFFLYTSMHGQPAYYMIPFNHMFEEKIRFSFIEPYKLDYGLGVRPGMIHKYLALEKSNLVLKF